MKLEQQQLSYEHIKYQITTPQDKAEYFKNQINYI